MSFAIKKLSAAIVAVAGVTLIWVSLSWLFCPFGNISVNVGKEIFAARCATCHSTEGMGGDLLGPNLSGIGLAAKTRFDGMSAEDYLLESIINPGAKLSPGQQQPMPENAVKGLKRYELLSLVAYLLSLGGDVDYHRIASHGKDVQIKKQVKILRQIDFAAAEAGRQLFVGKGNCVFCHCLRSMPDSQLRGPSLLGIGREDPAYIKLSIEDPSHYVAPQFRNYQILLNSGEIRNGRRVHSNFENKIGLLTETANKFKVMYIDRSEIETGDDGTPLINEHKLSPMANATQLTEVEIRMLVEFLRTVFY